MYPVSPTLNQDQSATWLMEGGVLAYPTEAVWGFGCNPFDQKALNQILLLKNRPESKGVILLFASIGHAQAWMPDIDIVALTQLSQTQTRPTTYIVKTTLAEQLPWISGKHGTLAIRICQHPIVQGLLEATGLPLVSTSLNPAGKEAARHRFQVMRYYRKALDANQCKLTFGATGAETQPSRIVDLTTQAIIRA